jgi:sirohydrochlorin cobaltochelatase
MVRHGILVLAHGTPSEEGTQAFLEIARSVEKMADLVPVAVGFMEFASPTIAEGARSLADRGVTRIAAVPVFLSGAGHTANDLPKCIEQARLANPQIEIELTSHVGSHRNVVELSALRYDEAVVVRPTVPVEETVLALVAHGSPEREAFEEFRRFASARENISSGLRVVPCFSQLGSPSFDDVLPTLLEMRCRRIVVQPHFLLKGRFIGGIAKTAGEFSKRHPEIEFLVTEPLGNHRLLAEAVLELGKNLFIP